MATEIVPIGARELAACEAVVQRGLSSFIEVGNALKAIRDRKLYRELAPTFEEYIEQRWPDLGGRRYANYVIAAAETVKELGTIVPTLPVTESQVRPLTNLQPAQKVAAWQRVLEKAATAGARITAALVSSAVNELLDEERACQRADEQRERAKAAAPAPPPPAVDDTDEEDEDDDEDSPAPAPVALPTWYTVSAWTQLAPALREQLIAGQALDRESGFNRTNDNVEWALWTWNPVTGCDHGCPYCYARDIAERFYTDLGPAGSRFAPVFRPGRLHAPRRMRVPSAAATNIGERNVFVCSMADLFGKWVPQDWIDAVFAEVVGAPDWNFLFLTKFPQRLAEQDWPANAWVGTTVDTQARVANAQRSFAGVKAGVKWLSCEPLLERLTFDSLEMFDWVVIGGQSSSTGAPEFQPPWEWTEHLLRQAREAGCQVYMKPNLKARPREYPQGASVLA